MINNGYGTFNRKLTVLYNGIITSIAFYPAIITFFYLVLVLGMLKFDYSELAGELSEEMPWLKFKEMETVRAIMTTLIAGIISLMALSFSMVMVVLNQATSTVSPKVMQGLITRKEHQFVLGNQFGTIVYFIMLLLVIRAGDYFKIPVFSISLGLLLGFWSLSLFVYFIHSISKSVQIINIIGSIHNQTLGNLKRLKKQESKMPVVHTNQLDTPYPYLTDKPGYLQDVNVKGLHKIALKYNLHIAMEREFTEFIPTGSILFRASQPPETLAEKDLKHLYDNILYFNNENIAVNHVYGFSQLSEIAIKSLSPGINDPGIAVICVQYLSDLFVNLYGIREKELYTNDQDKPWLLVKNIVFQPLFNRTIPAIRHYGATDESVLRALLNLIFSVGIVDLEQRRYRQLLNQHARAILAATQKLLIIAPEAEPINLLVEKMLQTDSGYFEVHKIEIAES